MTQTFVAPSRRAFIATSSATLGALALDLRPATATPETMKAAIAEVTKGRPVNAGKVKLDLPPLIENGNSVPLIVSVESPMTQAEHVRAIHLFNEKNPLPNIATFHLGPRSGRAQVSTRVRLGDTQEVIAIAELSDGTLWSATTDVVVTLPACAEEVG